MTNEELKNLALDISEGKVFGSWMIPEEQQERLFPVIFMPLALGAGDKLPDDVWALYEYHDKSGKTSHNGYPNFMSFKFLTKEDVEKLQPMLTQLQEMKRTFLET